jgi:GTP-binding protein
MDLLDRFALSYQAVMTKADTLKPAALEASRKKFLEAIRRRPAAHPEILVTSSETGYGITELRDTLAELAAQA